MRLDSLAWRLAAMTACGIAAYGFRHQSLDLPEPYWHALGTGLALYGLSDLFWPEGKHRSAFRHAAGTALRFLLVALILAAIAYILKISDSYSRLWSGSWLLSAWVSTSLLTLVHERRAGRRRLILVGDESTVRQWCAELRRDPAEDVLHLPLSRLLAWLEERDRAGDSLQGSEILLVGHVPEPADRTALILALHGRPVALRYCTDRLDLLHGGPEASPPVLPPPEPAKDFQKRTEDIILALLLLLVCTPIMLAAAVLVWRSGPGPLLFRQRRLGLGGQAFTIYKFRTMVAAAADQAEAPQAQFSDGRITPEGIFMRRWGLDELPQLFNVLAGHMSLVGPRPHAFPHDMQWGAKLPLYAQRFRMRPGITGLAQINGQRGYADTIEDIAARLEMDLDYIRRWSVRLDLAILLGTIPYMIRHGDTTAPQTAQPEAAPPPLNPASR